MVKKTLRENYLDALQEKRSWRFESNVKPSLEAKGVDTSQFSPRFFQDIALMQNRARGSLFELAGEQLITGHLQRLGHGGVDLCKQVRFAVAGGVRVADFFVPAINTIFEVKSGYVTWSKPVRQQVKKDVWLLDQSPEVARVVWFLFRGGSARALAGLQAAGVECFDLGLGGEASVTQPTTVINPCKA